MDEASAHLRALARNVVEAALVLGPLRAALLVGSAARGDADPYSDLDLLLYVDQLPREGTLDALRQSVGGVDLVPIDPPHVGQFHVAGVAVQVEYTTVVAIEGELEGLRERPEELVDSANQKVLAGLLEGIALHGEDVVAPWRAEAAAYPEPLRIAMVERHWRFFPLWYYGDALALRDAELWRIELLLDAAFDLLGVLAGVNRVYYARFQMKRLRPFAAKLAVAPEGVADRVEALFRSPPSAASGDLARLVMETREIVLRELPQASVPLKRGVDERVRPWLP